MATRQNATLNAKQMNRFVKVGKQERVTGPRNPISVIRIAKTPETVTIMEAESNRLSARKVYNNFLCLGTTLSKNNDEGGEINR